MNEKEKQAIERLERGTTDSYVIIKKDVRILLNLLEKQQAEIRQYDKALHDQIIKDYDMEVELKAEIEMSNEVIHKRNEEKLELASMCLKKDKIIDEMADYMLTELNDKSLEKICKNYSCTYKWKDNKPTKARDCKGCIKEYFKKKVEEK